MTKFLITLGIVTSNGNVGEIEFVVRAETAEIAKETIRLLVPDEQVVLYINADYAN